MTHNKQELFDILEKMYGSKSVPVLEGLITDVLPLVIAYTVYQCFHVEQAIVENCKKLSEILY